MMLLLVLLKQYDCFSSNSTLQGNLQTRTLSLILYPSEKEELDCKGQEGKDVYIEVLFPNITATDTTIKVTTANSSYKYQYGITLLYQLTYNPADFDAIIEREQATYRFCIDSQTICVSSSISILNHVEFNGQGCWNNVKIDYDFWGTEPFFEVSVEPNECDANSVANAYLYYEHNELGYLKVPILANDSLINGFHTSYSHMATKIFQQYKNRYTALADEQAFDTFVSHFDSSKLALLYLIVEYDKTDSDTRKYTVELETEIKQFSTPDSEKAIDSGLEIFGNKDEYIMAINPDVLVNNGLEMANYASVNMYFVFMEVGSVATQLSCRDTIDGFMTKRGFVFKRSGVVMSQNEYLTVAQVFIQFKDNTGKTASEIVSIAQVRYTCINKLYIESNKRGICYRVLLKTDQERCQKLTSGQIFIQLSTMASNIDSTTKVARLAYEDQRKLEDNIRVCYNEKFSTTPKLENQVDDGEYNERLKNFINAPHNGEVELARFTALGEFVHVNFVSLSDYGNIFVFFGVICAAVLIIIAVIAGLAIKKIS